MFEIQNTLDDSQQGMIPYRYEAVKNVLCSRLVIRINWRSAMVVYEVNLHVDDAVAEDFAAWLRGHIPEIVANAGFERAIWYFLDPGGGRQHWSVHYRVRDWKSLNDYFEHRAAAARQEALERFGDAFEADRRVLYERESFSRGRSVSGSS